MIPREKGQKLQAFFVRYHEFIILLYKFYVLKQECQENRKTGRWIDASREKAFVLNKFQCNFE